MLYCDLHQHSLGGCGNNRIAPNPSIEAKYSYVTEATFHAAIREAVHHNNHAVFVTVLTKAEYKSCSCYLSQDRCSGYAITSNWELISVFSWKGLNRGHGIVADAIKNGATSLHCFCGWLADMYRSHGFVIQDLYAWQDELAPAAWDYEQFGRPYYLRLVLNPSIHIGNTNVEVLEGVSNV